MQMRMSPCGGGTTGGGRRHPRLAAHDARVCLVECYDGAYARVFGPYRRPEALQKRETWNRQVPAHWRYEFWENWDDAVVRHREAEPHYAEASRWHAVCDFLAYSTSPAYVVRLDKAGCVVETLFGPVPRRVGHHAQCERIGVLDWMAKMASRGIFEQPPPVLGGEGRALTIWSLEWERGRAGREHGPQKRPLPAVRDWPSWDGLEAEPELFRNRNLEG